jgi:large subunit ribosomal protein L21
MTQAVIKTGGKQYVVTPGNFVTIEKLGARSFTQDLKKGDSITFSEVLLTDDGVTTVIGTPMVAGATVTGTVETVGRAKKIDVVKYKAKSRYLKHNGHRQPFIKVKIDAIS